MSQTIGGELNLADITEAKSADWYTPDRILDPVRSFFGGTIPLDPCTLPSNPTKAKRFFTSDDDGLSKEWSRKGTFINPPYGKRWNFHAWLEKIRVQAEKGRTIVALLPMGSRFSTGYWQRDVLTEHVSAVCWINFRVNFLDENGELRLDKDGKRIGNPHDSALWLLNGNAHKFAIHVGELGKVFKMENLA